MTIANIADISENAVKCPPCCFLSNGSLAVVFSYVSRGGEKSVSIVIDGRVLIFMKPAFASITNGTADAAFTLRQRNSYHRVLALWITLPAKSGW